MRLVIVQHNRFEHAGRYRAMLARDGVDVTVVHAPETGIEYWPEPEEFDALWVLGGVMQVWETDKYPWLASEIDFVRQSVAEWQKPYFGICLGHQMLAQATGGAVAKAPEVEFGVTAVDRVAADTPLLLGLGAKFEAFQWHGAEVVEAPAVVDVAAASGKCSNQVMTGAGAVGSVQFHPEVDVATIKDWLSSPGCQNDLIALQGRGADDRLLDQIAGTEAALGRMAKTIYDNWMRMARMELSGRKPDADKRSR